MAIVLINCLDYLGDKMAGPAIRDWEMAKSLSDNHEVILAAINKSSLKSKKFKLITAKSNEFNKALKKSDFIITQKVTPKIASLCAKHNTKIILDAYDPISIESLEQNANEEKKVKDGINKVLLLEQNMSFYYSDYIICASEKQRDLWLGVLSSLNKLRPEIYERDRTLRNLIDIVPFGIQKIPPKAIKGLNVRNEFGISKNDFVLLWGGGIWNWFDPLSLIKAVDRLKGEIPIKLIFMGIDHPNERIPRMKMVGDSISLSKELGLINKNIFFKEGWVNYNDRQAYLLSSDLGVSMHYDHLETRFSFRTRILDYIWAGLPIISTKGDSFAEIIEQKQLGLTVEYEDVDSIVSAIKKLYEDREFYNTCKSNIHNLSKTYEWDKCVKPIETMISNSQLSNTYKKINPTIFIGLNTSILSSNLTMLKKLIKKAVHLNR